MLASVTMHSGIQSFIPQKTLTKIAGKLANCQNIWIKNLLIKNFLRHYNVNMQEAERSDPFTYNSFNDFFTRELKPQARDIDNAAALVSPSDGLISQIGNIEDGQLIQAKKHNYKVSDLLTDQQLATKFERGFFSTIYLAPVDYHRVHMPLDGILRSMIYVPGKLFSVNIKTSEQVEQLFAKNERVICLFETELGLVAVILVGAMIVGGIKTVWHGNVIPPRKYQQPYTFNEYQGTTIAKGGELGLFELGSTVIVLLPEYTGMQHRASGEKVKFGEKLFWFS